jgi:hypothetical protein
VKSWTKALVALLLAGCGAPLPGQGPHGRSRASQLERLRYRPAPARPNAPATPGPARPDASTGKGVKAPLNTMLVDGLTVPVRIKASVVKVSFRSNDASAAFDCRTSPAAAYAPCPDGASYSFAQLVHGQAYQLSVRAHALDGRVDASPLEVAFYADFENGEPFGAGAVLPPLPTTLPGVDGAGARRLQLGMFYAVAVPAAYEVTSYSTTQTYNSRLLILHRLGEQNGEAYAGESCTRTFERIIAGEGPGEELCNATPTRAELQQAGYARVMPYDHVEMVVPGDERILIAAFESEIDPAETTLGIDAACALAAARGRTALPAFERFYGEGAPRDPMEWCEVQGSDGNWWWRGRFTAQLTARVDGPRITVVYSASARQGLFSGQSFAVHVSERIRAALLPILPTDP